MQKSTTAMTIGLSESQVDRCIGPVRWEDGILQQLYEVVKYRDGHAYERRKEWRRVPGLC